MQFQIETELLWFLYVRSRQMQLAHILKVSSDSIPSTRDFVNALVAKGVIANEKQAWCSMEKFYTKDWIEYGVSLQTAWMTDTGRAYVETDKRFAGYRNENKIHHRMV